MLITFAQFRLRLRICSCEINNRLKRSAWEVSILDTHKWFCWCFQQGEFTMTSAVIWLIFADEVQWVYVWLHLSFVLCPLHRLTWAIKIIFFFWMVRCNILSALGIILRIHVSLKGVCNPERYPERNVRLHGNFLLITLFFYAWKQLNCNTMFPDNSD